MKDEIPEDYYLKYPEQETSHRSAIKTSLTANSTRKTITTNKQPFQNSRLMPTIYDSIELSEQEIKDALLEARKKKYFHEKNKDYWMAQEKEGAESPKPQASIVKPV